MSASSYDEALSRVLSHEGGYTNDPRDPGGPTNFGITLEDYRRYIKPNATARDVHDMLVGDAKTIYRKHYWDPIRGDDLPAGVDYAVFDYGVNSGIARAAKVLQRLVGVRADGEIGEETIAAAKAADPKTLIKKISDERFAYLRGLSTWDRFGTGWSRRVLDVEQVAVRMADHATPSPATPPKSYSVLSAILDMLLAVFRHKPVTAPQPTPIASDIARKLVAVGSSAARLAQVQAIAARKLKGFDGEIYPHDGCAITLSCLMQAAGLDIPDTYQAFALGNLLKQRGWQVIPVGEQRDGDVGSTCGSAPHHGTDHIYLVLEADGDQMMIADNQAKVPHVRFASGKGGKSPSQFFLRAPR